MGNRLLGELELNRIYQRDCIEGMRMIPKDGVNMVLTDIPYGEVNRSSNGLRRLDKGNADVLTFDVDSFIDECIRVCSGNIYIFCGTEQVSHIRARFVEAKMTTRHCVWEKTNPSPMNGQYMWLSSIENCVYAKKKGSTHNEHCKGGVWRFPNGSSKVHPTQKPIKLFNYLVGVSSNVGDIVLDPCMGSGTTAVACASSGRNFLGFETFPEYIEIANKRLDSLEIPAC